jgi:tricorn protease
LKGQSWDKNLVSPLTAIGVNAKEGDYIIAVDGQSTAAMKNIYEAFLNTVGKQVKLTLNSVPSDKGTRDVSIIPIDDEQKLYYYNWVQGNIAKVDKATGGKVGYFHMPDMDTEGLIEFVKYYYPQLEKKALIIDVRGNGGGNVSPMIIERLRREVAMMGFARNTGVTTDPRELINGPKVCLMDEFSASDGDIFPYRFKKMGLGKLIGKRTWGGVIGIREPLPLLDGGILNRPEFGIFDAEGKGWIVEGYGVDPDIYVDNDPAKEFAGIDEQLNKAIEVIMEELKTKEKNIPALPVEPDKSIKK